MANLKKVDESFSDAYYHTFFNIYMNNLLMNRLHNMMDILLH